MSSVGFGRPGGASGGKLIPLRLPGAAYLSKSMLRYVEAGRKELGERKNDLRCLTLHIHH